METVTTQPLSIATPNVSHDKVKEEELNVLEKLTKLNVEQRLDTLEVCLGWTRNNRYCIYSEDDDQLLYVYEASVCFMRQVTGAMRGLVLKVVDQEQEEVMMLERPGRCSSRCCWACCKLQLLNVILPPETVVARVLEVWSCCVPIYRVVDGDGHLLMDIRGGWCHCRCCCQLKFEFIKPNGELAASVTRSSQGCKEIIGAANNFTIHFAKELSNKEKFIILGSTFLVDLNYFEKQNKCW